MERQYIKLTPMEYRFWLADQVKENNLEMNDVNLTYRITGNLNLALLKEALHKTINEYGPLHSIISMVDGYPHYVVQEDYQVPFEVISFEEELSEEEIQTMVRHFVFVPFRLDEEIPVRFRVLVLPGQYVFTAVMHHINLDGVSTQNFFLRLTAVYRELLENKYQPKSNDEMLAQYQEWLDAHISPYREKGKVYWTDYLRNRNLRVFLPSDPYATENKKKPIADAESWYQFALGKDVHDGCVRLSREKVTTVFQVLISAWAVTIGRMTANMGLAVEHAVNLMKPAFEDLYGMHVNHLPLKFDFEKDMTFSEILQRLKTDWKGKKRFMGVFFNEISSELAAANVKMSQFSTSNIAFVYPVYDAPFFELEGCEVTHIYRAVTPILNDLLMSVGADENLTCFLRHHVRFTNDYVRSYAEAYRVVLQQVIDNPDIQYQDIKLLPEETQKTIIAQEQLSLHAVRQEGTVLQLFKDNVSKYPDRVAVVGDNRSITYQELDVLSSKVAEALLAKSPVARRIGLSVPKTVDMVVAIWGILKAGCSYVPLDYEYPQNRLDYIVEDCGLQEVVVNDDTASKFAIETYQVPQLLAMAADLEHILPVVQPDADAYIIYTSGTTGLPKGTPIAHAQLYVTATVNVKTQQLDADSRVTNIANVCFDASIVQLFPVIIAGGTLYLVPDYVKRDPLALVAYLDDNHITYMDLPPALLSLLPKKPDLSGLKGIQLGGDVTTPETVRFWATHYRLVNEYGPTENCVDATYNVMQPNSPINDIGVSLPGVTCYVTDENLNLLPCYAVGELLIGGLKVTQGYINRPELNETKFVDNPFVSAEDKLAGINTRLYKSGDLVMRLPNGHLFFMGRKDNQVKIRGFRIELGEIEAKILDYNTGISNAVVIVKDINGNKQLHAYVESSIIDEDLVPNLMDKLKSEIPSYMIPSHWAVLGSFPLNHSGKVDVSALPEAQAIVREDIVEPKDNKEKCLLEQVERIMNVESIGVETDLFDAGMTSMEAMELVAAANQLGYRFSTTDLYRLRNIRKLASVDEGSLCFWYNRDERKPVLVYFSGIVSYIPAHLLLLDAYSKYYSIFLVERMQQFLDPNETLSFQKLCVRMDEHLEEMFVQGKVTAVSGFCFGAELAAAYVKHLTTFHPEMSVPCMINLESFGCRRKMPYVPSDDPFDDKLWQPVIDGMPEYFEYDGEILNIYTDVMDPEPDENLKKTYQEILKFNLCYFSEKFHPSNMRIIHIQRSKIKSEQENVDEVIRIVADFFFPQKK